MSLASYSFILPDAELSWSLWRSLAAPQCETLTAPAEYHETGRSLIVGLPATACRTVGLLLPTADKALLPAMIEAQLEKRGLAVETKPVSNFAYHLLGQTTENTVVSVDILAIPFPDNLCVNRAANYTAALRLMSFPQGELSVVEEHGLLVLVANHQGKLWHSHVLGTADSDVLDLARELDIAKLSLDAQEGFGDVRAVTLTGDRLAALKNKLSEYSSLEIHTAPALQPNRALRLDVFQKLLPPSVREAQSARAQRGLYARIGMLVAVLYAILFCFGWWYLNHLGKQVTDLRKEVAGSDTPAEEVKRTWKLWRQLEPAIDLQRYPMVQLSQIAALMPPSGVLLKRFEAKLNEIELRGDARDAQTVTQFYDDLKKHPKLSRYNWNMPVPSMKDKVASFKIQGKLEGEG